MNLKQHIVSYVSSRHSSRRHLIYYSKPKIDASASTTEYTSSDYSRMESADAKTYDGESFFGRYSGHGKLLLPDGILYEGEFWNGFFHGNGILHMADGKLEGTWVKGKNVQKKFVFSDGLVYEPESWTYCDGIDRRFYSEIIGSINTGEGEMHSQDS